MREIREKNFTCRRDGLLIRGMEFYPESSGTGERFPAIILSHGFTGNYTDVIGFCRKFAAWGYAAFCFSFCGGGRIGQPPETASEGDSRDMTLYTEAADLIAVVDYVKSSDHVMPEEIILSGFSQGGIVSGLAAARRPGEIKKLIMVYPALCIPDHARRGRLGGARYDVSDVPEELECLVTVLGRGFYEEASQMDPFLELAPFKGPVLILQGMEDQVVNYSYAIRAKENYEPGQCALQLMERMGHGQNEQQEESMFASMRQFLDGRREILTFHVLITQIDETVIKGGIGKSGAAQKAGQTDKAAVEEAEQTDKAAAAGTMQETAEEIVRKNLYFTGYCNTEYFRGVILPGGCDCQEHVDGQCVSLRAEYTLYGLDRDGKACHLHVINSQAGEDFCPVISTDSEALSWLNTADLTAVLEDGAGGVVVRVYAFGKISAPGCPW
ncbi:MAG: alpha/beta fold hydrolase [Lachnospiraceae bacterium]|nr:alpha/beta fold hydrolase [Lachnospiraceae bacterium]